MRRKMIKLCDLNAIADRKGNVFKDDKGRVKHFTGMIIISVDVLPSRNKGESDYALYLRNVSWDTFGYKE